MTLKNKREQLHHKAFMMMFKILVIFGIPAIVAFFAGRWIDTTYAMRPYGSVLMIILAMILSWGLTIRLYIKLTREYKALEIEEENESKQKVEQKNKDRDKDEL